MPPDFSHIRLERLPAVIAAAPKAELHVHIEGTLEPELAFEIGRRNGVSLPYDSPESLRRARDELGISAALIMCFLRHLTEREAFETLERAEPFREHLLGVGLDSGEQGNPPEKFAKVFGRCRRLDLHAVVHAGEEGESSFEEPDEQARHVDRLDELFSV